MKKIYVTLILVTLTGCSGILSTPAEPPRLVVLNPVAMSVKGAPLKGQIGVEKPILDGALNTNRIALRDTPFEVSYFADITWEDELATMVQHQLVRGLDSMGMFTGVGLGKTEIKGDYVLQTHVHHFEVDYLGTPQATIAMTMKLVKWPERKVLKTLNLKSQVPISGDTLPAIGSGFTKALEKILGDLQGGLR